MADNLRQPRGYFGGCLIVVGGAWALLFLMAILGFIIDEKADSIGAFATLVVFLGIGVAAVWSGFAFIRRKKRLREYLNLVRNQGHRSLKQMAEIMGATPGQAMRDVQALLSGRYLDGLRLDPDRDWLVPAGDQVPAQAPQPRLIQWTCGSCGAANQIQSLDGRAACTFCGTPHIPTAGFDFD
jgi:hypothetical protein